MKIYTKTGDKGTTSLLGGTRVSKDDLRIEAYGTLDELNSHIGLLIAYLNEDEIIGKLSTIQSLLFNLGSHLAAESDDHPSLPELTEAYVTDLEVAIDHYETELEPMKSFILPGGSVAVAQAHVCRTVARRAERRIIGAGIEHKNIDLIVKIMNRLSDFLFVLSRLIAKRAGIDDVPWVPSKS